MSAEFLQTGVLDPKAEELRCLEQCRAGNEQALGRLVARHRLRITRVANNILRDQFEAEDVAQESFIKAFRELPNLRDDRAFSSYLYRICVRLCMDRLRARKATTSEWDGAQDHMGGSVENRLVINKLLKQLSSELRLTLVLREVEQLSYEEIAAAMKVPVGTVRSRLHAAREKFRMLWIQATGDPR